MSAPDPRDVLRWFVTDDDGDIPDMTYQEALAAVDALVEAARGITFAVWEGSDEECEAAQRFRAALARFAGDRNPPA